MSSSTPSGPVVTKDRDNVTVNLRTVPRGPMDSTSAECVIDVTDFGDVLGIEVLNVSTYLRRPKSSWLPEAPWISYDSDADALYIRLPGERQARLDQRVVRGYLVFDDTGVLASLQFTLP